jgi:hypothetical protein
MKPFAVFAATMLLLAASAFAQQPATEPLHFSKLIPLLPEKAEGFVAEKAEGSTSAAMGFKITEVSRRYTKGKDDAEQSATIKITDGAGNQFFAAAHAAMVQFSNESTEGYEKGFTLDSYPAVERYTNDSKSGSLTVFVGSRYLVEVDVAGLDGKAMQEWWKKLDVKQLVQLKPE